MLAICLAFILAGLYFITSSLTDYAGNVPYYPCRVLFSDDGSDKDYRDCEALATGEDKHAMLLFGLANLFSRNMPADPAKASSWIEKAAQNDYPAAMFLLGALNSDDFELNGATLHPADIGTAVFWLEKAAAAGHPDAELFLAALYLDSPGLDDHMAQARRYLIYAVNKELPLAFLAMGLFELNGIAGDRDPELARNWLDLYARAAIPEGTNEVAWLMATASDSDLRDNLRAMEYIPYLDQNRQHAQAAMYIDTIAAVYAANGDFGQAVTEQAIAIDALEDMDAAVYQANIAGFRERLDLYEAKSVWTETVDSEFLGKRMAAIQNQLTSQEVTRVILNPGDYSPAMSSNN